MASLTINRYSQPANMAVVDSLIRKNQVVAPLATDLTPFVAKGNDSVKINVLMPMEVDDQEVGSVDATERAVSYNQSTLLLDRVAIGYTVIDMHLELQNLFENEASAIREFVIAIGLKLEDKLITQAIAAATLTETARTTDFYTDVIAAKQVMRTAKVPVGSMNLVLDAAAEAAHSNSLRIVANGSDAALNGPQARIAGFNAVVSNSASEPFFFHQSALCYAWHDDFVLLEAIVPKTTKKNLSISRQFGSVATQTNVGGKSPLIYKWGETSNED